MPCLSMGTPVYLKFDIYRISLIYCLNKNKMSCFLFIYLAYVITFLLEISRTFQKKTCIGGESNRTRVCMYAWINHDTILLGGGGSPSRSSTS